MTTNVLTEAIRLTTAGLSVVPVKPDGSKAPPSAWAQYQNRIASLTDILEWFTDDGYGLGVLGGKVSGNLEILDFDDKETADAFGMLVKEMGMTGLVERLVLVRTPSGGFHLYYRCPTIEGNKKLAREIGPDGGPGDILIETRGEAGYVLAPGSPVKCHELEKPYELIRGDLATIPTITVDDRDFLLNTARSLNQYIKPTKQTPSTPTLVSGNRPGDQFNSTATWQEVLEPHGWVVDRHVGEETHWRRPGKERGSSATTNHDGNDLLYCFSSNGHPFESDTGYEKFHAYTLLNYSGDFSAAAQALSSEGYRTTSVVNVVNVVPAEGETATKKWPTMEEKAFHGLAGECIKAIEPHTESDRSALLIQFLTFFGNVIGRSAHFKVEKDLHYLNLNMVLVGRTAKGRKGTALGHIKYLFRDVDESWLKDHLAFGLSSGEGLIWAVRDPIEKQNHIKEKGRVVESQTVIDDPGVEDKRLLVIESEFASTLRVMSRDGNILSAVIRNAWDTGNLRTLTKNNPARATGAHISIIGHITADELTRDLNSTEAGNGFGNRFLWMCVKRSKILPEGGKLHEVDLTSLIRRLDAVVAFGKKAGEVHRDKEAKQSWKKIYTDLSVGKPGLLGSMIARGEAQVMRLACIYALLDRSDVIHDHHLHAALAVWDYAESSCQYIFVDSLGDPVADQILAALRRSGDSGQSKTQLRDLFGRNKSATEINRALSVLVGQGLARSESTGDIGRPTEKWLAVGTT